MCKKYVYLTCCVDAEGEHVEAMENAAKGISYDTFIRHCNPYECGALQHYDRRVTGGGLTLRDDWQVQFYKSKYRGVICYVAEWSGIDLIWVRKKDAEKLAAAGDGDIYAADIAKKLQVRRKHESDLERLRKPRAAKRRRRNKAR